MEGDTSLHTVHKTKYRFVYQGCRFEIDVYPFSNDRAIMRAALPQDAPALQAPPEITVLREVTDAGGAFSVFGRIFLSPTGRSATE